MIAEQAIGSGVALADLVLLGLSIGPCGCLAD
jgi:hypothetical protein